MEVIPLNDWFAWNGKRCTDFGVHVSDQPPLTIPAERVTYLSVPGRPGSLTTLEGEDVYDDLVLTAACWLADPTKIPAFAAWLKGSGKVTFAHRPSGWYEARIANQISFEQILRGRPHRTFAVNFRCKPFWYQANVQPITLTTSTQLVTNPGSVYAEPVITVYGEGNISLMVGTTIVQLEDVSGSITLDTPLMEAYTGATSQNGKMTGEFPVLKPGANAVSWSGSVTKVVVQPNWRFI